MLLELAANNADIRKLLDDGYALRFDRPYLVVRDVPYLDSNLNLQMGAIVTVLEFVDKVHVKQQDHQVYFAGSAPYGTDGKPIPNLGGGLATVPLAKNDQVIQRSFSNKPLGTTGFSDFHAKINSYVRIVSGPAIALHKVSPLTFRVDNDLISDSVFKIHDTLTSRAEIGDLAQKLKNDVIAIIGLGGTGAFILDFMTKAPVKEIRGFDGDAYHVHTAFRSPGMLHTDEFGRGKASVYQARYDNFRVGLKLKERYIDRASAEELSGVTFAFVCVDKGSARKEIIDLLIDLRIPFLDVGMGLDRKQGAIGGTARFTYFDPNQATLVRDLRIVDTSDDSDDVYRRNVQVAEVNALNACLAVIKYKQLRGYYLDERNLYHLLMNIGSLYTFGLTT